MAFKINIVGDDSFEDAPEKAAFERHLVEEVSAFVLRLQERRNVSVSKGSIVTDSDSRDYVPSKEG
jgi:hypothetical protein